MIDVVTIGQNFKNVCAVTQGNEGNLFRTTSRAASRVEAGGEPGNGGQRTKEGGVLR